ncbi:YafY family transcriptional regulator [Arenibacter sp. N53]|uniref:helix-turn-helix transcriptional regulator n=1 Tax=Arenibacter TaxID=178469 RepID=UPI000CD3E8D8|nr:MULTISPECIES: YafY family protein [Arenibacter]MCM4152579.1 YafY family transcriptional regulator [Arenibacter sp. N53]
MTRLTRLTNILLHLQSRRVVTAQEIVDKFNIAQRTVYRDIRALEEAGVPIIGEAGKGYSLADGYRIPPVMFTQQEINALLTAQKYFQKNADKSAYNDLVNVVTKIKAIIRYSEKGKAEKLEERLYIFSSEPTNETNFLSAIQLAITNCWVIKIKYHTIYSDTVSDRFVEPLAVYFTKGNWIMVAFCRLRKDLREFRIDRILNLITTTDVFPDCHFSFENYFITNYEK